MIRCPDAGGAAPVNDGQITIDGVVMRLAADLSVPAAADEVRAHAQRGAGRSVGHGSVEAASHPPPCVTRRSGPRDLQRATRTQLDLTPAPAERAVRDTVEGDAQ